PAEQWLEGHEQVGHALPPVLVVVPGRRARPGRNWLPHLADELPGLLVDADHRPPLVVGPVVHVKHVLHPGYELGRRPARQAPPLPQVRLQRVFLRPRRTVSWETASTTSNSTSLSASIRSVHALRPSGAAAHASAISRASAAPSSTGARAGAPGPSGS